MAMQGDPVVAQLRKLREGRGLTRERIAQFGELMSSLGTSDPDKAFERLIESLEALSDRSAGVLRIDYGLNLGPVLGRAPVEREQFWLGDRRASYAELISRDSKTLARWSNAAVSELRSLLISDAYSGDIYIVAGVRDRRIVGISHIVNEQEDDGPARRISTDFENSPDNETLPFLIYAYPRDWTPKGVHLVVTFLDGDWPKQVWGFYAPSFPEFSLAKDRVVIPVREGRATCTFKNPSRQHLYGLSWNW